MTSNSIANFLRYLWKTLRVVLWCIGGLLLLVILLILSIQLVPVQNFIKDKGVSYLQNKLKTRVEIGHIAIRLPGSLSLNDVYIGDQKGDTLLSSHQLNVEMDLPALLQGKINIKSIRLNRFSSHINRTLDTNFNFGFMAKAFAGAPEKPKEKPDTTSLRIKLDDINLSDVHLSYQDTVTGYHARLSFENFHTHLGEIDLQKMQFYIKQALLKGMTAKVRQENVPAVFQKWADSSARADSLKALIIKNAPQSPPITMEFGKIVLSHDSVQFNSKPLNMVASLGISNFMLGNGKVDLGLQTVNLAELNMSHTQALVHLLKALPASNTAKKASVATASASKKAGVAMASASKKAGAAMAHTNKTRDNTNSGWKVDLGSMNLNGNEVVFNNDNAKLLQKGMDFNHLHFSGLSVKTENLHYESAYIKVLLHKLELREKSGFLVKKGEGSIYFDPKQIKVKNLALQTGNSGLNATILLSYPSLSALSKTPGELKLDTKVGPSWLGLQDILYFQPSLSNTDPFKKGASTSIRLRAALKGSVKDLQIGYFEASTKSETHLMVTGRLQGLPDASKLNMNLHINDLSTGSSDILALLSKNVIPRSVHIPQHLKLNSRLQGSLANLSFDANLKSSLGDLLARGSIRASPHRDTSYTLDLNASQIQAGLLSGQGSVLGKVSLHMNVEGSGLSLNRANAKMHTSLESAVYKGYVYKNLLLDASIQHKQITLNGKMADTNLHFDVRSELDLSKKAPSLNMLLRLDSIDFKALNFSKTKNKLRGIVKANIVALDLNKPEGNIELTHFLLTQDSLRVPLDSLRLQAHTLGKEKHISLESEYLKASLDGEISFTDIAEQLRSQLNHYYAFIKEKTAAHPPFKKYPNENFNFALTLLNPPSLRKALPQLSAFKPIALKGGYKSADSNLSLSFSAPRTQYAGITVDSLRLSVQGDSRRLNYSLNIDSISSASLDLQPTHIHGFAENSKLTIQAGIEDTDRSMKYHLAGIFTQKNGNYQFHFLPDSLILNKEAWSVAADNLIEYGKKGVLAHNMNLSNGRSKLSINSEQAQTNSPIKLNFDQFDLLTLSKFIAKDSVLVGGKLNGEAEIANLPNSPLFTSNLNLNDFSFKNDTLGTISIKVNNHTAGIYNASVSINGHGNDLRLAGNYKVETGGLDLNLTLNKLNLKSAQVYSFGQISQAKGFLSGQMKVTGLVSKPEVNGFLAFNQAGFNISYLNSYFNLPDEKIAFDGKGIHFSNFVLLDSARNKLSLNGDILSTNYTDFAFNLGLSCRNFRLLNTTAKDNSMFYGKVYVNSDIKIRGDLNKPKIDATLRFNKQTNFTYVVPADDPSLQGTKGIVEFIRFNNAQPEPSKKKRTAVLKGLQLSANISTAKEAHFAVVIDPQTEDALKVQGEATLNATMDPSGKISLTGRYQIENGSYQLSINSLIKKVFSIKKGGYITWTGDPTSADVDLTAVYTVHAPSIDLMEQQTSDQSELNQYKNQLPFLVNFMMKGELLKPSITFGIDLSENDANLNQAVKNVLDNLKQDPSELNKQVFALLVLGRFVGQNPLQAASGGLDAGLIARQSAGKLLSQQLNKLAGSLIKGVDLNFGLNSSESYSSSGQQTTNTTLQVGATKQLNERISVSVGSDIALEGSTSGGTSSTLIGDVSAEYKLSRDGRYRLRAFRRNATEAYVEGQFIETGLSFLIVVDYNHLKEIFQKSKSYKPRGRSSTKKNKPINKPN